MTKKLQMLIKRIFDPGIEREGSHRSAHNQIGYHFAVIAEAERDHTVKQAE